MGWCCSGSVPTNPTSATETDRIFGFYGPCRLSLAPLQLNSEGSIKTVVPLHVSGADSLVGLLFQNLVKLGRLQASLEEHALLTGVVWQFQPEKGDGH